MDKICDGDKCTGCGLCSNVCPKNAISMVESKQTGHFIPTVDQKKCVDCGICEKNCPSNTEPERHHQLATYAAWCESEPQREGSSSGGIAANFYQNALEKGYAVVGACLEGVSGLKLKLVTTLEEAQTFRGSKYIQANAQNVYSECLEMLKMGRKVLFVGTPCQCAAARSMGARYKDGLLTVELICHGTPSQKVFRDYVRWIEEKKKKIITNVSFRSSYGVELTLKSDDKTVLRHKGMENEFLLAFQNGVLHNHACYACPYAAKDRCADITIGDFWKIGTEIPFQKPSCKVSVLVINTEKGKDFLKECKGLHLEEREYDEALKGNPNLYRASTKSNQYDRFWTAYHQDGIAKGFAEIYHSALMKKRWKNNSRRKIKEATKIMLKPVRKYINKG